MLQYVTYFREFIFAVEGNEIYIRMRGKRVWKKKER